jgi:hypothetical protein
MLGRLFLVLMIVTALVWMVAIKANGATANVASSASFQQVPLVNRTQHRASFQQVPVASRDTSSRVQRSVPWFSCPIIGGTITMHGTAYRCESITRDGVTVGVSYIQQLGGPFEMSIAMGGRSYRIL